MPAPPSDARNTLKLCNVADDTVTPPTSTGSSLATGVSSPRLPTPMSTSTNVVRFVRAAASNFNATRLRGARAVAPARFVAAAASTLNTTPSTSKGSSPGAGSNGAPATAGGGRRSPTSSWNSHKAVATNTSSAALAAFDAAGSSSSSRNATGTTATGSATGRPHSTIFARAAAYASPETPAPAQSCATNSKPRPLTASGSFCRSAPAA
mmetsp:Transcript_35738/g.107517  ORF Transcript_35738/g.107517 Transcript_35738/m.107517 type:complete len:209 (-) Transcript_35738:454-1080(-)